MKSNLIDSEEKSMNEVAGGRQAVETHENHKDASSCQDMDGSIARMDTEIGADTPDGRKRMQPGDRIDENIDRAAEIEIAAEHESDENPPQSGDAVCYSNRGEYRVFQEREFVIRVFHQELSTVPVLVMWNSKLCRSEFN